MNANYIFDIFETANAKGVDTTIALEILRGTQPIPEGMTKEGIGQFVGLHFDQLRRAHQTGNRKLFSDIVTICVKSNDEEADALLRAHETGNEKLIAEMEAKYGDGADHV